MNRYLVNIVKMKHLYRKEDNFKTTFQLFLIIGLIFEKCLVYTEDFEEERVRLEPYYMFIKHDSSSESTQTAFHQRVDISILKNTDRVRCYKTGWFCLRWSNLAKFQINKVKSNCEKYEYVSKLKKPLRVRFDITDVFLYGGAEQRDQTWPADHQDTLSHPFVSFMGKYKGVLEPFWLLSNGMYLYVDERTPLFITQNQDKRIFEIIAENKFPYIRGDLTELVYTVCKLDNMKDAFYHAVENFLGKPSALPNLRTIKYPSWSTLNNYYQNLHKSETMLEYAITDEKTMKMAKNIVDNNLPPGNLIIDGYWDYDHGSLVADNRLFSNMEQTIRQLKTMGFSVNLMIFPDVFENNQSSYVTALQNNYFVKNQDGSIGKYRTNFPGNQLTSFIDMTNPTAFSWFLKRLNNLTSQYGIDSFKFYIDDDFFLPQPLMDDIEQEGDLETWLEKYVHLASLSGNMSDVSFARGTQKYPLFVRMHVRETEWDSQLGLATLIPTLLQMNIIGYPFVSPDVLVGNGVTDDSELFIRWLQINVFMPCMQFSFPPWIFGQTVMEQTRKFIDLHTSLFDKIKQAMENSVKFGTPVNPPIWWIDPLDPETYEIDSEFLLGEDILIAPIVERSTRSRNIYLPKGCWKDEFSGNNTIFEGPIWLYNYPADLYDLPYFSKVVIDNTMENVRSNASARYPWKTNKKSINLSSPTKTIMKTLIRENYPIDNSITKILIGVIMFTVVLFICWKWEVHKRIVVLGSQRFSNFR